MLVDHSPSQFNLIAEKDDKRELVSRQPPGGGAKTFAATSGALRLYRSYDLISNPTLVYQEVYCSKLSMFVDVVKMKVS